ncbi:helix-turn-helix domain-containing protein [Pseudalkalibacillus sp. NRS-1564]|uniref:helix-turn-helix domain-containing protein n=1 Tax=Pseudalkalibacillus sp. NRS-1564 TaxID=3233900 RepID=UPI003D2E9763
MKLRMISENIKKYRGEKSLSLTELAKRSNVSKSYLSSLERDIKQNPSINIIERIANVLEVDVQDIFSENKYEVAREHDKVGSEWFNFIKEVKMAGIKEENLIYYKELIEFINWKNKNK